MRAIKPTRKAPLYTIQVDDVVQHKTFHCCGTVTETHETDDRLSEREVRIDWEETPDDVYGLEVTSRRDLCLILAESPDRIKTGQ